MFQFSGSAAAVARPPKYGNTKTVINGDKFDSAAEASRYQHLLVLQRAGHIRDLTRQVSFVLAPAVVINGKRKQALVYRADFSYFDTGTGRTVVEDKKGALTDVYKIKRHLMKAVHNIDIFET